LSAGCWEAHAAAATAPATAPFTLRLKSTMARSVTADTIAGS
jgi:hypothetical protein